MRCFSPAGEALDVQPTAEEQSRYVHDLCARWTGEDPRRLRCLAALQLRQAGWTYARIAIALRIVKGAAHKYCRVAEEGLRSVAFMQEV